jgi:hypothetical protein
LPAPPMMTMEMIKIDSMTVNELGSMKLMYRLSHNKFQSVIGRRRITIQPPPSGLVKFNM